MIPPTLHLYWGGPAEPCWLRRQTVETWARLHPGHVIRMRRADDPSARASDIYRWRQLLEVGGWWSDMDIIWYRSPADLIGDTVPASGCWLTYDGDPSQPLSIGCIAALPGSPLIARALEVAEQAPVGDYQAAGVRALHATGVMAAVQRGDVGLIPHDALYVRPALHAVMEELWAIGGPVKCPSHGLHWYGGHPLSQRIMPSVGPDYERTDSVWAALVRAGVLDQDSPDC